MEHIYDSMTLEDFDMLGKKLAALLDGGGFIAFFGDLGAGKTTLVKLIAKNLGITEIASPTFTVVREHETSDKKAFFHFDAYRLEDEDELSAIGFDDYIERAKDGIIVMEWSENVLGLLPDDRLDIAITGSGDMKRTVKLSAYGKHHESILRGLLA
ncbi:MAG: tRNA (adenosine(37)-N6)-threonylcarbamoyltransferase complex ATPase subunit type 1 TsaE [Clostridia bacterium]|nr:tRNA (adenosine(37)-N6)-threonylcarbamoyltransferase complex ATPase subunit type 1 TsaE [Clostridia bacterium]